MLHFCTYFDSNYLLRGLTMYRSLVASGCDFTLHVLTLDDTARQLLETLAMPEIRVIRLQEIEAANPALAGAKANRSKVEYYFTLTPSLPLYILDRDPDIELITYLDADLYFHASPVPLLDELGDRSVLITDHRYPPHLEHKAIYGRFNVQFQAFRRDPVGLACLRRWRDQCIDWCYDRPEANRYADQKYLDEWPALYGEHLVVLQHKGGGVAPWNWSSAPLELEPGGMMVGGQPLIFYHFHGVKIFGPHLISNGLADWGLMPFRQRRWLYAGYIREMRASRRWLRDRTGAQLAMKDNIIRGKGLAMSSLGEIARKAWSQAMLIP